MFFSGLCRKAAESGYTHIPSPPALNSHQVLGKKFDLLHHTIGAAQFIAKVCTFLLLSMVIKISVKKIWAILESNQHESTPVLNVCV
jgi:large-conductance mechanosensitive channel